MPNDPLHFDNLAGPPNDADYQAAYAEITATERGRRFLIEYAIRNRHPDTHILVSTIAHLEVPVGLPPGAMPRAAPNDLLAAMRALSGEELIALFS